METEYFNIFIVPRRLVLSQECWYYPKMPAWKNQKRHNKSLTPVITTDTYIVGAVDIMTITLLLNEGGVFTTQPAGSC